MRIAPTDPYDSWHDLPARGYARAQHRSGLEAGSQMSRYVEIFFRFWIRFLVLLVLIPAVVGAATIVLFPSYRATSSLWVDSTGYYGYRFTPVGWNQYLSPAQNETDSLSQLMATGTFVGTLGDRLAASGAVTDPVERRQVLGAIYSTLKVRAVGSHLMTIGVTCDRRPVCVAILDLAIPLFRELETQLQKDQVEGALAFLSSSLDQAETNSRAAEDALGKWKATNPALKADAATAATDPGLYKLLTDLQAQQSTVRYLKDQIKDARYVSSAGADVEEIGPRVIDSPHLANGGLIGDGSSLKRALLASGLCVSVGVAYLMLMTWIDKTARDTKELERRLKVRVVTTIDQMRQVEHLAL
jgi:hypothetical protein